MHTTDIQPWLSVNNAVRANEFYKAAFGAIETYRLETPDGLILRLAVNGTEFWISGGLSDDGNEEQPLGGNNIRLILITEDPNALFDQALKAGATEIFPVGEDHGWKLGRLADPFGLHWEIGYPTEMQSK